MSLVRDDIFNGKYKARGEVSPSEMVIAKKKFFAIDTLPLEKQTIISNTRVLMRKVKTPVELAIQASWNKL